MHAMRSIALRGWGAHRPAARTAEVSAWRKRGVPCPLVFSKCGERGLRLCRAVHSSGVQTRRQGSRMEMDCDSQRRSRFYRKAVREGTNSGGEQRKGVRQAIRKCMIWMQGKHPFLLLLENVFSFLLNELQRFLFATLLLLEIFLR